MVMEQNLGMDLGHAICSKSDVGQAIEAIITQLEKQAGVTVHLIRCDGAPEFMSDGAPAKIPIPEGDSDSNFKPSHE